MTENGRLTEIEAVVFDMDGTLTQSNLDFDRIRAECGAPPGRPVLEHMEELPQSERGHVLDVLQRHERRAARECCLQPGAIELLRELRHRGFKTALLTRNSAESVRTVLERFPLRFDCWLSREDARPKPSPEPLLKIARALDVPPERMLMVGDYKFDVQAGRAAGSRTAFLLTDGRLRPPAQCDLVLKKLADLPACLPESVPVGRTVDEET